MASEEEEKIIEEFMAGDGRAQQWRAMRESLQDRLKALRAERASTTSTEAIAGLDRRIAQIVEQVRVLEQEEAVSQFVEDSVRATLRASVMRGPGLDDDDEEE